jgi:hypothetical protein
MLKTGRRAISVGRNSSPAPLGWTFLTNHSHVLLCIHCDPTVRLREIAQLVGITERMVQKIVAELIAAGYLDARKEGRRNHYAVDPARKLRHPLEAHHAVGELLEILANDRPQQRP